MTCFHLKQTDFKNSNLFLGYTWKWMIKWQKSVLRRKAMTTNIFKLSYSLFDGINSKPVSMFCRNFKHLLEIQAVKKHNGRAGLVRYECRLYGKKWGFLIHILCSKSQYIPRCRAVSNPYITMKSGSRMQNRSALLAYISDLTSPVSRIDSGSIQNQNLTPRHIVTVDEQLRQQLFQVI